MTSLIGPPAPDQMDGRAVDANLHRLGLVTRYGNTTV